MRRPLPLPSISLGVALVTLGLAAGVAMTAGVVPVTSPSEEASPSDPGVANIGGDQPPMEYEPSASSSVKPTPSRSTPSRPSLTPPPHTNPVVTPETAEPRMSLAATTVVPPVSLPTVAGSGSAVPSSGAAESGVPDVGH